MVFYYFLLILLLPLLDNDNNTYAHTIPAHNTNGTDSNLMASSLFIGTDAAAAVQPSNINSTMNNLTISPSGTGGTLQWSYATANQASIF